MCEVLKILGLIVIYQGVNLDDMKRKKKEKRSDKKDVKGKI